MFTENLKSLACVFRELETDLSPENPRNCPTRLFFFLAEEDELDEIDCGICLIGRPEGGRFTILYIYIESPKLGQTLGTMYKSIIIFQILNINFQIHTKLFSTE